VRKAEQTKANLFPDTSAARPRCGGVHSPHSFFIETTKESNCSLAGIFPAEFPAMNYCSFLPQTVFNAHHSLLKSHGANVLEVAEFYTS